MGPNSVVRSCSARFIDASEPREVIGHHFLSLTAALLGREGWGEGRGGQLAGVYTSPPPTPLLKWGERPISSDNHHLVLRPEATELDVA